MNQLFEFFTDQDSMFFHHHAEPILASIGYKQEPLKQVMTRALNARVELELVKRNEANTTRLGVKAQSVNDGLRKHMVEVFGDDVLFEVKERQGFWEWGLKKEGFDFAVIDHLNNFMQLRNACFGERPLYDGKKVWDQKVKDSAIFQKFIEEQPDYLQEYTPGVDAPLPNPDKLPVLGEIQFGNHALRGVDMFRLMKAHRTSRIGLIVYVAPTGNLESHLSSGIVTYSLMKEFLNTFDKEINVPIWLLGLDFKSAMNS